MMCWVATVATSLVSHTCCHQQFKEEQMWSLVCCFANLPFGHVHLFTTRPARIIFGLRVMFVPWCAERLPHNKPFIKPSQFPQGSLIKVKM